MKYKNGDVHIGNYINDLKDGKGLLITSEGKYECEWEKNEINGFGKIQIHYKKFIFLKEILKIVKKKEKKYNKW